jgi:hypothetical protein
MIDLPALVTSEGTFRNRLIAAGTPPQTRKDGQPSVNLSPLYPVTPPLRRLPWGA